MKHLNKLFLFLLMTGILCMATPFTFTGRADENNSVDMHGGLNGNRSLLDNITVTYTYPMLTCAFAADFPQLNISITGEDNTMYYQQTLSVTANTSVPINVGDYPDGNYSIIIKDGQGGTIIGYFTIGN